MDRQASVNTAFPEFSRARVRRRFRRHNPSSIRVVTLAVCLVPRAVVTAASSGARSLKIRQSQMLSGNRHGGRRAPGGPPSVNVHSSEPLAFTGVANANRKLASAESPAKQAVSDASDGESPTQDGDADGELSLADGDSPRKNAPDAPDGDFPNSKIIHSSALAFYCRLPTV